jgi:vitamin B12 transporter
MAVAKPVETGRDVALREIGRGRARAFCVVCAALAAGFAARNTRAEEQGRAAERPPRVERATPPVIVEEVRPTELPEDPSAFTTVIDAERFEGENRSIDWLLDRAPGVQVRRFGGPGAPSEVSIRGSTANQVVVLLDGVRINSTQNGTADLSTIAPEVIERIEVSRGGGVLQTGSGAIGGVVNVITRRPSAAPQTTLSGSVGSFETYQAAVTQTGRLWGLELLGNYDFFRTSGAWTFEPARLSIDGRPLPADGATRIPRVNNDATKQTGLVKVGRDLGEHYRVEVRDQLFFEDGGRPGLDDPSGGALRDQSRTARLNRLRNVGDIELEAAEWTPLGLDAGARLFSRYERTRFQDPEPPGQIPPIDGDDRDLSLGLRLEASREIPWGYSVQVPSLALQLRRDSLRSKQSGDHQRGVVGLLLQDDISLVDGRMRMIPAIRFDETQGFAGQWLPRIGVILTPLPWLRIKGNAESSYRVPTFNELYFNEGSVRGNPNLLPEQARNLDVGLDLGFDRIGPLTGVSLEVAGFHNDIANSIVFQRVSPNVVQATNVSDATVIGVELAAGLRLFRWLGFSAAWTHLDSEIRATGNPLPGRPEDEYTLRLELGLPGGPFRLATDTRYVSEIPADQSGRTFISGRQTWDASVTLDVNQIPWLGRRIPTRKLLLSVIGANLTDVSVRDALSFPQPGRAISLRLEAQL